MGSPPQHREDPPPPVVAQWLRGQLGEFHVLCSHRAGSSRTGVWKMEAKGAHYYCKVNRRRVRWATELFAYRNWMPALRPHVPELRGVLDVDDANGLLLTALDGVPLRESARAADNAAGVYRKAGELLAQLHDLPSGTWYGIMDERGQPTENGAAADPVIYYRRAIQKCLADAEAARALDPDEERIARSVLDAVPDISFPPPTPTFFDYTPGNWIVDGSGGLSGIIDFEHMAWGLPADPFARLLLDYFPLCEQGREAFYAGYGRDMERQHPEQVRIGCAIYALYYKTLATRRNDPAMADRARRAFAACR